MTALQCFKIAARVCNIEIEMYRKKNLVYLDMNKHVL